MHEFSIAYDLYATARKAAIENNASKVKRVTVEVGMMAMVNPEQVTFLFCTVKEDDPLFEKTELVCTEVPAETTCPCGYSGQEIYVCPACGALPRMLKGKEIVVINIEIEVD